MPYTGPAGREPMLLYLVKQVELAVRARLDEIVRPAGLTALQYTALTVLERHSDMSAAQLARHSFVTAQSMADMIAALQARGLIERHRDRADRRRLVVALTAEGHDLLDRYRDTVAELEEGMLADLSAEAVEGLRHSLHACHANLAGNARPQRASAQAQPDSGGARLPRGRESSEGATLGAADPDWTSASAAGPGSGATATTVVSQLFA